MDREVISAVADALLFLGQRLRKIAGEEVKVEKVEKAEVPKVEAPKVEAPVVESPVTIGEPEEAPAVAVSAEELRKKCVVFISKIAAQKGGRETLVNLFAKFKAKRLGDITDEKIPEFYDAIQEA
jgi:hypothetical protein